MTAIWPRVPIEAIRQGADFNGARVLARLAGDRADFLKDAVVELSSQGFIAAVRYVLPGAPNHQHTAHVGLVWAPRENAAEALA